MRSTRLPQAKTLSSASSSRTQLQLPLQHIRHILLYSGRWNDWRGRPITSVGQLLHSLALPGLILVAVSRIDQAIAFAASLSSGTYKQQPLLKSDCKSSTCFVSESLPSHGSSCSRCCQGPMRPQIPAPHHAGANGSQKNEKLPSPMPNCGTRPRHYSHGSCQMLARIVTVSVMW